MYSHMCQENVITENTLLYRDSDIRDVNNKSYRWGRGMTVPRCDAIKLVNPISKLYTRHTKLMEYEAIWSITRGFVASEGLQLLTTMQIKEQRKKKFFFLFLFIFRALRRPRPLAGSISMMTFKGASSINFI